MIISVLLSLLDIIALYFQSTSVYQDFTGHLNTSHTRENHSCEKTEFTTLTYDEANHCAQVAGSAAQIEERQSWL